MFDGLVSVFNPFNNTQLTAICEFLSKKEAEGLKLFKYTSGKFTFKKAPPAKARYCAVVNRSVRADDFLSAAEERGWEFISTYNNIYFFRSENLSAREPENDPKGTLKVSFSALSGTLVWLGLVLFHFLRVSFFEMGYKIPIEVNNADLTFIVLSLGFVLQSVIKITHYILWRIKATNAVKNDEAIPFYNLKQAKRLNLFDDLSMIAVMLLWFGSLCVFSLGYTDEIAIFWVIGGISCLYVFAILLGRIVFERKHTAVKAVALLLLTAVMLGGIYGVTQLSLSTYETKSQEFLSYNGNPVSVTDFGFSKKYTLEKEPIVNVTPLAEYYIFRSSANDDFPEENYPYIYYYVFRSDSKEIVKKTEKHFRDKVQRLNSEIRELEDEKWDYLCIEVHDGKELDCGYAIKGNTIIYLDICDGISFKEFFDKAYEKIF